MSGPRTEQGNFDLCWQRSFHWNQRERVDLASAAVVSPGLAMPAHLGDFHLLREAGRGGMGVVYEAVERPLNRHVAVKVLDQRVTADAVARQRFEREARAAASLHHTNIVPVFAIGNDAGVHYYVMPFLYGVTLAELLAALRAGRQQPPSKVDSKPDATHCHSVLAQLRRRFFCSLSRAAQSHDTQKAITSSRCGIGPLDPDAPGYFRQIASIGLQIADGLEHAAQHGILHRDIKPANLMLTDDGTVWIMDFGLARFTELNDLTATGEILGTPRYLAPERLSGKHTVQGDIYGLGMVLYELLTLETAFESSDRVELLHQISTLTPRPPRRRNPRIPKDLDTIVLKCIEKNVSQRYQSPSELFRDLRLFLDDLPIASRRISRTELTLRWCRRSPGLASLLMSVVLLLAVIAVGALFWVRSLGSQRDLANEARRKAVESEQAKSVALSLLEARNDEHRRLLYRAYADDMKTAFESSQSGQRLRGLQSAAEILKLVPFGHQTPDEQRKLRNAVIASLSRFDASESLRYPLPGPMNVEVDIHPDFEFIAIPGENFETALRWLNGLRPDLQLRSGAEKFSASRRWFSPCGRWLYEFLMSEKTHLRHHYRVWDLSTRELMLDISNIPQSLSFCFDPVRSELLHLEGPVIRRYDLRTGQVLCTSAPKFSECAMSISSDGKLLAVLVPNQPVLILDAATFEQTAVLKNAQHNGYASWISHSSRLLTGTRLGSLELWNALEGRSLNLNQQSPSKLIPLCTSPDGRLSCTTDSHSMSCILDVTQGCERIRISGSALRFSKDSRKIAVRKDRDLVLYELSPSDVYRDVLHQADTVRFSPNGALLTTAGLHGVFVYGTNPLELQGTLGLDHCGPVAWHPSGTELATFGIFSHLARWPVRIDSSTGGLILDPPQPVMLNPVLAKLGADDNVPQHAGRYAAWTPDGAVLYFADARHECIRSFCPADGKIEVFAECPRVSHLTIAGNGKWLATVGFPFEETRIWDLASGKVLLHLPETGAAVFSDDGEWLAVRSISGIRLFAASDWKQRLVWTTDSLGPPAIAPLTFQPKTSLLAAVVSSRAVRLFDAESGTTIADLTYQTEEEFRSLAFSPDGSRLAVVRQSTLGLWDLAALNEELLKHGVPGPLFPRSSVAPPSVVLQAVNRGTLLLPADKWWTGHELLAKFEALRGNFPDAIGAMNAAMKSLQPGDEEALRKILIQRAEYYLAVENLQAAHTDLMEATRLKPADIPVSRMLAELQLFGPPDVRDTDSAESLLQQICASDEVTVRDQLHQILVLHRRRPRFAQELLETLQNRPRIDLNTADQILLELVSSSFDRNSLSDSQMTATSLPDPHLSRLSAADQYRIRTARELLNKNVDDQTNR